MNISKHNPSSVYCRNLVEKTGMSQREISRAIGVSDRSIRDYVNPKHRSTMPFVVQFALEQLAKLMKAIRSKKEFYTLEELSLLSDFFGIEVTYSDGMFEAFKNNDFLGKSESFEFIGSIIDLEKAKLYDSKKGCEMFKFSIVMKENYRTHKEECDYDSLQSRILILVCDQPNPENLADSIIESLMSSDDKCYRGRFDGIELSITEK